MQQLKSGSLLQGGKYKIEKVLGQGGFGITYLATQELLDRKVCIKEFFFKEYCERDEATSHVSLGTQSNHEIVERFMNKFLKEARTISQLNHPNIIRIHDIFKENNTAYYVMEYIEGMSLAEMVKQQGVLSEDVAVSYIKQVASALEFVHQHSINHLDVKPANVMVRREDNQAVLIDFGLSKQYDAQGSQTSTTPVGISHGYAPMEQYNAGGVSTFSPQTDIYSLGATLYKLVTGITPPQACEVLNDGLPELPISISRSINAVIKTAMQPRKIDRPDCIEKFLLGLNAFTLNTTSIQKDDIKLQNQVVDDETKVQNYIDINTEEKDEPVESSDPQIIVNSNEDVNKKGYFKNKWIGFILFIVIGCIVLFFAINKTNSVVDDSVGHNNVTSKTQSAQEIFQQGIECYEKKNYANAIPLIIKAAEMGDVDAQTKLAYCYYSGEGVAKNHSKSLEWTRRAANQNSTPAIYYLGIFYSEGIVVGKDMKQAIYWWNKATNKGYAPAQYKLGICYLNGDGIVQNLEKAKELLERASKQGNEDARLALISWDELKEQKQPVDISGRINGYGYVDLGLSVKWATCNVGALIPSDFGDYFAWGEISSKSKYLVENSKAREIHLNNISGDVRYDVATSIRGEPWRMPTKTELEELKEQCKWIKINMNGHNGYKIVGPNGNFIFLPAAGYKTYSSLYSEDTGFYWSSSSLINEAYYLSFNYSVNYFTVMSSSNTSYGQNVRPVLN